MFLQGASSPFWLQQFNKHAWKCPEISLKTLGFVTTNTAVDGSTSCEKYTGLVTTNMPEKVQALIQKS